MKGLLVRVGIDATAGCWNAPVDPETRRFVYMPIPEAVPFTVPDYRRVYDEWLAPLREFRQDLPAHLCALSAHVDPDFEHLTYGDAHPRSLPLADLEPGDFLVFYSGLRPVRPMEPPLLYAIIGFYVVQEILRAREIPWERWHENAHTRRSIEGSDIVVRARHGLSGRLERCVPIGDYRNRAYRVRPDLLEAWGGLSVKNGFIQRSGRIPRFLDPARFLDWFDRQQVRLIHGNY